MVYATLLKLPFQLFPIINIDGSPSPAGYSARHGKGARGCKTLRPLGF